MSVPEAQGRSLLPSPPDLPGLMLTHAEVCGHLSLPIRESEASLVTNFGREEALLEGSRKASQLPTRFPDCGQFCRGHLPSQQGGGGCFTVAFCCVLDLKILTPTMFPQKNHLKCLFFL